MPDIIQLLPDNIANQIAAGEVIQRPSSAVKELLENAIDAGSDSIQLIINDAGKSLIQVIDNGKGMTTTDARMAFERHATSKINTIEDLFHIKTMGFRGEALASIAAVAQIELKTKTADQELGTYIEIENSVVIKQEPIATNTGTSIAMKNLFFNIPARRNFLKSNTSELRHIIDEFTRVTMAFPHVHFSFINNSQPLFILEKGSLKQRITQLLGNNYNAKLVPVQEHTDYLDINGFIGKPETAKKTRGDQYFFVNNRFIKSPYLNHAVATAFDQMIGKDCFPTYALFIQLDSAQIDINVHPTKQEIKFEDEKIVYAFVQAAVKHALAQFSIAPSLDFTLDASIQQLDAVNKPFTTEKQQQATSSSLYKTFSQKNQAHKIEPSNLQPWKEIRQQEKEIKAAIEQQATNTDEVKEWKSELAKIKEEFLKTPVSENNEIFDHDPIRLSDLNILIDAPVFQLLNTYIIVQSENGFILIHQQLAHERVLYEKFINAVHQHPIATQQNLFPTTIHLSATDAVLLNELLPDLNRLGYSIELFGNNAFVIQGTPADIANGSQTKEIEQLLERYKHFNNDLHFSKREKLIRSMAAQQSIKQGQILTEREIKALLEQLAACKTPNASPNGKPTYIKYTLSQLSKIFE